MPRWTPLICTACSGNTSDAEEIGFGRILRTGADQPHFPQNAARLIAADQALCAALAVEGWLDEIPPA